MRLDVTPGVALETFVRRQGYHFGTSPHPQQLASVLRSAAVVLNRKKASLTLTQMQIFVLDEPTDLPHSQVELRRKHLSDGAYVLLDFGLFFVGLLGFRYCVDFGSHWP